MRRSLVLCLLIAAAPAALAGTVPGGQEAARDEGRRIKPAEKGDTISVKGCLSGNALIATESDEVDAAGVMANGVTFRLDGRKGELKSLREAHDGKLVTVRGELKSDLRREQGQSATVGRMRITIGGAPPNPNSPQAANRRSLPVLELESFTGSQTPCAR